MNTLHIDKIVERFPANHAAGMPPPPPTYYCHRRFGKKEYVVLSGAWREIAPTLFRPTTKFSDRVEIICESAFARNIITKVVLQLIGRKGRLVPAQGKCPACETECPVNIFDWCDTCGWRAEYDEEENS